MSPAGRERRRIEPEAPLSPGEYVGTVLSVEASTSAAGNRMDVWTFALPVGTRSHELKRWTLHNGAGAAARYETVTALGLPRRFKYSQAVGRQCRLVVGNDGAWPTIERAKPL